MKSAQLVLDTLTDYYILRGVQVFKLPVLPMCSYVVYYRRKIVVGILLLFSVYILSV